MKLRDVLTEAVGVITGLIIAIGFIGIISVMIVTGGTADKAVNGIFDTAIDRLEAELESDGE